MTTAQQLGLVGNSVRVQALPTASAETFGQGNRYYTLIGQQEGYITGHTYHTVVANDVYSWEDVACGNYNMLDNIPVINQDLTASGFTPVANTYYRHTGATNNTFTQGVIYLYDTAYHKLGESGGGGGGTTLNRYTYTVPNSTSGIERAYRIINNAKGGFNVFRKMGSYECDGGTLLKAERGYGSVQFSMMGGSTDVSTKQTNLEIISYLSGSTMHMNINIKQDGTITVTADNSKYNMYLVYYNDTEIT